MFFFSLIFGIGSGSRLDSGSSNNEIIIIEDKNYTKKIGKR